MKMKVLSEIGFDRQKRPSGPVRPKWNSLRADLEPQPQTAGTLLHGHAPIPPTGRGEMLWREKSAIPQDNILGALICADIYYPMSLLIYQSCGPKADQRPFWVAA